LTIFYERLNKNNFSEASFTFLFVLVAIFNVVNRDDDDNTTLIFITTRILYCKCKMQSLLLTLVCKEAVAVRKYK